MGKVRLDLSISLDGFVAGPDASLEAPLGQGGEQLHAWAFATASFRRQHGMSGGEANADDAIVREMVAGQGATVMGRRMFSGGEGPWEHDSNARGWWGDDPPFHHPVFVLTHHRRPPLEMQGGTTFFFVDDGVESAVEQARAAAGDGDVSVGGGAAVADQLLDAGLLDELQLHVVPVLLGAGARLFDHLQRACDRALERVRVVESPTGVTHLKYRAAR